MKMSEFELQDVASTLRQEDMENLKAIQRVLNKEINNRMEMKDVAVPCYQAKTDSFGYCTAAIPQEKEPKKMNTANSMSIVASYPQETIEERRISFLASQLQDAKYRKETELERHFGLIDDEAPQNPKQLVERIKDGMYVIPEEFSGDDQNLYNPFNYITWRNPKVKKDKDGCAKAKKEMNEHFREAQRIIILKDEEKGLAALEKFEKAKFH